MLESLETPQKAPIVLLIGSSTAGKSTICNEILRQDKELESEALGCKIWGEDLENGQILPRCEERLTGIAKFEAIKENFPGDDRDMLFCALALGHFR